MEAALELGDGQEAGRVLKCTLEIWTLKGHSGEVSDGSEEHIIRNWREGDLCYKVGKNLAELCSSVLWKVEFMNDKTGYLAEEISKQSVEGVS